MRARRKPRDVQGQAVGVYGTSTVRVDPEARLQNAFCPTKLGASKTRIVDKQPKKVGTRSQYSRKRIIKLCAYVGPPGPTSHIPHPSVSPHLSSQLAHSHSTSCGTRATYQPAGRWKVGHDGLANAANLPPPRMAAAIPLDHAFVIQSSSSARDPRDIGFRLFDTMPCHALRDRIATAIRLTHFDSICALPPDATRLVIPFSILTTFSIYTIGSAETSHHDHAFLDTFDSLRRRGGQPASHWAAGRHEP